MALSPIRAKVAQVRQLTHDVREVTFQLIEPDHVTFKAGQYVYLDFPHEGKTATRAYSICSAPIQRERLCLVANLVTGGPGSHYFFGLTEDTAVHLRGPTGQFVLDEQTARDYCFIATGTGIAPLYSMIRSLCERGATKPMRLLWGLRSERDLYYQDTLSALADRHPNFRFTTTLSQPSNGWRGSVGRVTAVLPHVVESVDNLDVYLCGSHHMIAEVKTLLRTKGLCPIHTEKFY